MQSDESCPCKEGRCVCALCAKSTTPKVVRKKTPKVLRKKGNQWHQEELPFYNSPYETHKSPDEFFRNVSKPDPSTVEADLQTEEKLWES